MPCSVDGHQPTAPVAFTVTITHPITGVTLVGLVGELDLATGPTFDFHLADVLRNPSCTHLILNVSHLSFCAAVGLRRLLHVQATANLGNVGVSLVSGRRMNRLLALTGLHGRFVTFPTLTAALDSTTSSSADAAVTIAGSESGRPAIRASKAS